MKGLGSAGSIDEFYIRGFDYLAADQTCVYTNFTPPSVYRSIGMKRKVSSEDVLQQKLDLMPGFRFSWWYTGAEVRPDNKYKNEEMTKLFVR